MGTRKAPAVEMTAIRKQFGNVIANDCVNFSVDRGSITGLVGENGAGKTTLMNILYGYHHPDSGTIAINGQQVAITSSRIALNLGIGMVHQHFMLVDRLSVLENVVLGRSKGWRLKSAMRQGRERINEISNNYQLKVDSDAIVRDLPVGTLQRVEIIKALYHGAKILILDEPTAVLTEQETHQLFSIVRNLQADGVTCLLITHKLREIMAVTDQVAVMRRGKLVEHFVTSEINEQKLANAMIPQEIKSPARRKPIKHTHTLLAVKDLHLRNQLGVNVLQGISFKLRAGEILGIAGVAGNGQSELLQVLTGMSKYDDGTIKLFNREYLASRATDNPLSGKLIRDQGLAHIPEDRGNMGLIQDFPAYLNYILGYQWHQRFDNERWLTPDSLRSRCQTGMKKFDVRPVDPNLAASNFSGGNQQKLIVARELHQKTRVLIAGQPTRGVDIGSIAIIHDLLLQHRNAGGAILLISSELDEILALSDRIIVMLDGKITGEVSATKANREQLGLWMASHHNNNGNLAA